jgi:outer membrane protein OmpA-like peptidoglycan-associated protein
MDGRMASAILLAFGCADLAVLNLRLAPRLQERAAITAEPPPPARLAPALPAPAPSLPPAPPSIAPPAAPACAPPTEAGPDVVFEFGEERVPLSATPAVRRVAEELRGERSRRLFVRGHADRLGSSGANVALSWKRAEAVRALLAAYGAPLDHIALEAVGDAEPQDPTESPTGWARNRRVQLLWR